MMYEGDANDQFTVKVADALEDVVKLMEGGFEYLLKWEVINSLGSESNGFPKKQTLFNGNAC